MIKRELQQTLTQQTNAKVLSLMPFRSVTKGAGAQFVFPASLSYSESGEHIFISDNDGIKVFSGTGKFERLIRPYFGIFSFIKSDSEGFFANTLIRNANSSDPLIVELDRNGKEIRGLGLRQNITGHNGLEDQAFLALSQQRLFAAFKYRRNAESN